MSDIDAASAARRLHRAGGIVVKGAVIGGAIGVAAGVAWLFTMLGTSANEVSGYLGQDYGRAFIHVNVAGALALIVVSLVAAVGFVLAGIWAQAYAADLAARWSPPEG